MFKSGKFVASLGIGLVCLLLVVATFAFTQTPAQPAAQAAPAAQATATPVPSKPASETAAPAKVAADNNAYQALFNKTFAAKLGVSEDALKTAFAAAISETSAQMVKDGVLDSNGVAKLQAVAANGPGAFLPFDRPGAKGSDGTANPDTNPKVLFINALPSIAPLLKLSPDELQTKWQNGQSLAELAAAASVDPKTLENTLVNNIKGQLDAAVKAGKITQAQADDALKEATGLVSSFINNAPNVMDKTIKTLFNSDATWQAAAQTLNLPVDTLKDRVKGGQTVLQIAQAQQVDEGKLRQALQTSLQNQLADLVKNGQLSADQSAQITPSLSKVVEAFINDKPGTK